MQRVVSLLPKTAPIRTFQRWIGTVTYKPNHPEIVPSDKSFHVSLNSKVSAHIYTTGAPYRSGGAFADRVVVGPGFLTCIDGMGGEGKPGTDIKVSDVIASLVKKHGPNLNTLSQLGQKELAKHFPEGGGCTALSLQFTSTTSSKTHVHLQSIGDCSLVLIHPQEGLVLDSTTFLKKQLPSHMVESCISTTRHDAPIEHRLTLPKGTLFIGGSDSVLSNFTPQELAAFFKNMSESDLYKKWDSLLMLLHHRVETGHELSHFPETAFEMVKKDNALAQTHFGASSFYLPPKADDMALYVGMIR